MLDQEIRKSVAGIPNGASVAVVVTGRVQARDGDLFLLPSDISPVVADGTAAIDAEAIRLSFLFRRLAAASPKEIVAVLDDCSGTTEVSNLSADFYLVPVSILCATRRGGMTGENLVLRVTEAMKVEGLTFEQFANKLRSGGRDGSLEVVTSKDLSRTFYFLDPHHFDRIDDPCNKIAIRASAAQARTASLAGPIEGCTKAMHRWPYAQGFRAKRDAGLEQQTFQNTMKSCQAIKSREGYKAKYPNGRYVREASTFLDECTPPPPPRPMRPQSIPNHKPARSPTCRTFNFNGVIRCE
ncbi:hypothetical protein [Methylobacterium sp. WL120]|uniref:hypothetical protein n=1 Tax=Methylobacterium sp. WL120 TaxID=2603887 RepID=UPI0011CC876F|nr:hypothetical protein [Methylobacterium sp. WL120]TXM61578.1 hypothetical protein FV229_23150 [Methylobacterium sp. WL120]